MKLLVSLPGIHVRHCDEHGLVNVTVGGTTLHLDEDDFARLASALGDAAAQMAETSEPHKPRDVH